MNFWVSSKKILLFKNYQIKYIAGKNGVILCPTFPEIGMFSG